MRGNAELRHVGRHGPAQVMKAPILGIGKGHFQAFLEAPEAGNRRRAGGREHKIRVLKPRYRLQDLDHERRERNDMRRRVFHPRGRQAPQPLLQVKLRPAHARDFTSALTRQDHKLDALREGKAFKFRHGPTGSQLIVAEHSFARRFLRRRLQGSHRRCLDHAAINAPVHELFDRSQRPVRPRRCATGNDRIKHAHDIGAFDLIDRAGKQRREFQKDAFGALPVLGPLLGVKVHELRHDFTERLHPLFFFMRCNFDITAKLDRPENVARLVAGIMQRQDRPCPDLDALHLPVNALGDVEHLPACG